MAKFGYLIGSGTFAPEANLPRLRGPSADTAALKVLLDREDRGKFSDVKVWLDRPSYEIKRELYASLARHKQDDFILVYFSGHGILDVESGRLFLSSSDTDTTNVAATGLDAHDLLRQLRASRVKRTAIVLDCCFSGALGDPRKGEVISASEIQLKGYSEAYGTYVLSSSSEYEQSRDGDLSPFTEQILHALETGDADVASKGYTTLSDLYLFTRGRVSGQTPRQFDQGGILDTEVAGSGRVKLAERRGKLLRVLSPRLESNDISGEVFAFLLQRFDTEHLLTAKTLEALDAVIDGFVEGSLGWGSFYEKVLLVRHLHQMTPHEGVRQSSELADDRPVVHVEQPPARPVTVQDERSLRQIGTKNVAKERRHWPSTVWKTLATGVLVVGVVLAAWFWQQGQINTGVLVGHAGSETKASTSPVSSLGPSIELDPASIGGTQALLLEASPNGTSGATPFSGPLTWSNGSDENGVPTLNGRATIPSRGLEVQLLMRLNTDPSLPASHLVEIYFTVPDSFVGKSIARFAGILLKNDELVQGQPLVGAASRIVGNSFLFALSSSPADEQTNIKLLTSKRWMDLAITYATGENALITLEKDDSTDKLFDDTFAAWDAVTTKRATNQAIVSSMALADPSSTGAAAYVQLSSKPSEGEAAADALALKAKYGTLIGANYKFTIQAADLGAKGIRYRVRIPTSSLSEAASICEQIKAQGGDCFPTNG